MKIKLYALKDTLVAFKSIWTSHNDETAIRAVKSSMEAEKIPTSEIEDLQLWYLGTYNDQTGIIESSPKFIAKLTDIKNGSVSNELL